MGMKSPAKKKEIVKRSRPTDAELAKLIPIMAMQEKLSVI